MKSFKEMNMDDDLKLPCQMVPFGLNPRFLGRSEELKKVKDNLDPQEGDDKLRVMAIHGLGGVGKTQLALYYANTSMKLFDVIAWIPAETHIKMIQALSVLAKKLGLPKETDTEDDYQASLKVKDWLNRSAHRFLLIFDNVDNIDTILQVWPASDKGSILLTTRSPAVAAKRARHTMNLGSFRVDAGPEVFISLTNIEPVDESDHEAARELCRLLGGLPLAMVQISDFIRDRGCSYGEFLPMYQKSSAKITARLETPPEYNHTLSTVWDLSIAKLPENASALLELLAFFDPDKVEETLLTNPQAGSTYNRLQFLEDEFE